MTITISKADQREMEQKGVFSWPIWECEPSTFDWHYDQEEVCYVLEGEVTVTTKDGQTTIAPGDFVTFPRGLDCQWTVHKRIRKHYSFR